MPAYSLLRAQTDQGLVFGVRKDQERVGAGQLVRPGKAAVSIVPVFAQLLGHILPPRPRATNRSRVGLPPKRLAISAARELDPALLDKGTQPDKIGSPPPKLPEVRGLLGVIPLEVGELF